MTTRSLVLAPLTVLSFMSCALPVSAARPTTYGNAAVFAGGGTNATATTPLDAQFSAPVSVTYDTAGNLYIVEWSTNSFPRVRKLGTDSKLQAISTTSTLPLPASQICIPSVFQSCRAAWSVAVRSDGTPILAADAATTPLPQFAYQLFTVGQSGVITSFAGSAKRGFADGAAGVALFAEISALAVDGSGNTYVADDGNSRIRKVSSTGVVTTIAGTGTSGSLGDGGQATLAQVSTIGGIAYANGAVYLTQPKLHTVRRIRADGIIETVAGNGLSGTPVDGTAATNTSLNGPTFIASTPDNRIVFYDGVAGFQDGGLFTLDTSGALWAAYRATWGSDRDTPVSSCFPATGQLFSTFAGSVSTAGTALTSLAIDPAGNVVAGSIDSGNSAGAAKYIAYRLTPTSVYLDAAGLVGAASYNHILAPGSVFVLFRNGLDATQLTNATFDANGLLPTSLGNTQILFDGIPAPLLWYRNDMLAGMVPFGAAQTQSCAVVQVKQGTQTSAKIAKVVFNDAAGIFTLDSSGAGQAAALNEDGSINGPNNRVAAGHVIVLYVTGAGVTSPASIDGALVLPPALPKPIGSVSVKIGGQDAQVNYAGAAPYLAAGMIQVNAVVPTGTPAGASVAVDLYVNGDRSSQFLLGGPVTIAVK